MFGIEVFADQVVFVPAAMICIFGAIGVVSLRNPVHNALSLVATLFGVAILFVIQEAYFLASIQVIVYAGAVVVLFLFVIMLLGIDRDEELEAESDPMSVYVGGAMALSFVGLVLAVVLNDGAITGQTSAGAPLDAGNDLETLGRSIFVDHVFAFEITSVLLIIAVIGAVVLSRRSTGDPIDAEEFDIDEIDEIDDLDEVDSDESEEVES
jgi:NADH-quinone oxidoreductase subunit J